TRSKRLAPAFSRLATSTTGRQVPDRDFAPNSANSRRRARGIPDSDSVPPARATSGSPFRLLPGTSPAVRILAPRTRPALAPSVAEICLRGADPFRPSAAGPEASALPPPADAPAIAGTRDSSARHWALPFQQFADGSGDLGHSQLGIVMRHSAHQFHFLRCERAPTKCHIQSWIHGRPATRES